MSLVVDDREEVRRPDRRIPAAVVPGLVLTSLAVGALVTIVALGEVTGEGTTHAGGTSTAFVGSVVAATALLLAGTFAWSRSLTRPRGSVLLVLAAAWVAPLWVGWVTGPPLVRSVGELLAPLAVPAIVHLCLLGPADRIPAGPRRWLLGALWGVSAVLTLVRAAVRDPLLDLTCWSNCTANVFLIHPAPQLARFVDGVWRWGGAAACLVGAGVAVVAARDRRALAADPLPVPAAATALVLAGWLGALAAGVREGPGLQPYAALYLLEAAGLVGIAAAAGWLLLNQERLTRRLGRLAHDLATAPRPGTLEDWLARALDDPGLTVVYRRPGNGATVDAGGRPQTFRSGPGRIAVPVVRGGEELAVVVHSRGPAGTALLRERLGAAARLAVDNERLGAELLAQLHELQASRARLVETADAERRALERDLHDGAQQRLLAALHRLERACARSGGAAGRELVAEAEALVDGMRRLAHGIFPAVLDHAGLVDALESLAEAAPIAVLVEHDGDAPPLLPSVSHAAYAMVAAAITTTALTGSGTVDVRVGRRGGRLLVEVIGPAIPGAVGEGAGGASWTDRVAAAGGHLEITPNRWRVELPCASP